MKHLKKILFIVSMFVFSYSYCDHASGGYFEYTCIGNNQYRVEFTFLRHCAGNPYPPSVSFYISNSCGQTCSDSITATLFHNEEVKYGCNNGCAGSNNDAPNFQMAKYRAIVTLPTPCAEWKISVTIHGRQGSEFGEFPGNGWDQSYYNYCKINNLNGICTSSAKISGLPITIGCVNNAGKSLYDIDPNGNNVTYSMVSPLAGECGSQNTFVYESGTSITRPVPSNGDFVLTPNGQLVYYPNMLGTGFFAVKIVNRGPNNEYLGETVIDGASYTSTGSQCQINSTVNFSNWSGDNDNSWHTTEVDKVICNSFTVKSNKNGETIGKVAVKIPAHMTSHIVYNQDGTATVTICTKFDISTLCSSSVTYIEVRASTTDAGCIASSSESGYGGYYNIVKDKGQYCPENLYFTNRKPTGTIMPNYAKAEKKIWVGDDMPAPYDPILSGVEGDVIAEGDVYLIAGNEVILPSCNPNSTTATCVYISGTVTIEIKPNSCSAECDIVPLNVSVKHIFKCGQEKLVASVYGEGMYTYNWTVNGVHFTTTDPVLNVHNIVSANDGEQLPYTCEVFDAVGQSGSVSGYILGTKRFYEPVKNATKYYDFQNNPVNGPDGNYYGASIYVTPYHPAYIWDDVNSRPPWYGATEMKLTIWGSNGQVIYQKDRNLDGGEDWSFDNGEYYWNGHHDNEMADFCAYTPSGAAIFNYRLIARNCYTDVHTEEANFRFLGESPNQGVGCTLSGSLDAYVDTIKIAKTITSDGKVYNNGVFENRVDNVDQVESGFYLQCIPNPTKTSFEIKSNQSSFTNVRILDQSGKVVMNLPTLATGETINIESLSAGIYTLELETHHIKLVKE